MNQVSNTDRFFARRRLLTAATFVGCLLAIVSAGIWWSSLPTTDELTRKAKRSLRLSEFESALTDAESVIRMGDDNPMIRLLAGEAAQRLAKFDIAVGHFNEVDDSHGKESLAARLSSASIMIHKHQVGLAEDQLHRSLKLAPEDYTAHRLMADCLGLQGRRWESIPHLLHGIRSGEIELQSLCYLADTDRTVELSEEQLAAFLDSTTPKCWLGAACVAISYREFEKAEELIRKCLDAAPDLTEAHVRLGKLLLSRNDSEAMNLWDASLPPDAEEFPEVWFIRSQWCLANKDEQKAAGCLWQALKIAPNHVASNHQMAQVLSILGRPDEAKEFRERGLKLTRLATLANEVYLGDTRSIKLKEAAVLAEGLGRIPEALGWSIAAEYETPGESWPKESQQRLSQLANSDIVKILSAGPSANLDYSTTPWLPPDGGATATSRKITRQSTVSFKDASISAGIDFVYANAEDLSTDGRLMFEYTGGGIAAFDFDMDGFCDMYFTQAGPLPPFQNQTTAVDALYRNSRTNRFEEVSRVAGVQDTGFGQGVATGDFNNDGFPDLYVANIDGNRLYVNHGDGTFEDVTNQASIRHPFWTTSVAIADLDLDSIPDLYDVTFLTGTDVFNRVCEEDGVARSCAPAGFDAADDFLFRGRGDGSFDDVSEPFGIRAADGDGLGILVADFGANGTPSIFIANDGRANFYFTKSHAADGTFTFTEEGLTRGLAFDRDGSAQACMGIASSDFDGDGNLDLFVTNFFNESNTLYTQYAGESFGDSSQNAGIREASLGMLAFGVQAIDGDLDGWEDLLIGNGHVDDFSYKGIPYKMPLEYFRNEGNGHFEELTADQLGDAFQKPTLSRSMAVIDWNNDGLPEVAVSRLDDSALLLENNSSNVGQYLGVRIVGINCARDASTARLVATVNGRKIIRQFTAGDGYQSSNQKQVIFGLDQAKSIEELLIIWPGGKTQTFNNIASGQTIAIREGNPTIWQLPLASAGN